MIPIQTTYLKPRTWTKYLFLLTPTTLLVLYFVLDRKDDVLLYIALGSLSIFVVSAWLLNKVHVMLDNYGITYKSAFFSRNIEWHEVTSSYFRMRHTGKSTKRLWYFENITGKSIHFSTSMFSRASLQTIAECLVGKCPDAAIDQKIRDIAEGKFPWYIF